MQDRKMETLDEILGRLFVERGWGRQQERQRLEQAWAMVAGAAIVQQTRPGVVNRGVLDIEVTSGVLLQELAHFHKKRLLIALQNQLPALRLKDIRFRAGSRSG